MLTSLINNYVITLCQYVIVAIKDKMCHWVQLMTTGNVEWFSKDSQFQFYCVLFVDGCAVLIFHLNRF